MHLARCLVCGEEDDTTDIYFANLDASSFSPGVLSAERPAIRFTIA